MDEQEPSQRSFGQTTSDTDWGEAPLVGDVPVVAPKTDGLVNRRRRQITWAAIVATFCSLSMLLFSSGWPRGQNGELPQKPREVDNADSASVEQPESIIANTEAIPTPQPSLLEEARNYWVSEDFDSVVRICTSILDADPDNERALLIRSSAFAKLDDWSKAAADHLELKRIGSDLWRKPSPEIANALVECAKAGMIEGYKAMDRSDLKEAKIQFDQSTQLLQSASVVSPSSVNSTSLTKRAILWSQRCALAKLDTSGQLTIGLQGRVWKDSTGSHSFVARLVQVDTKVRLEGIDGRQVTVEISKLSSNDQKWIQNHNRLVRSLSKQTPAKSE